jgi:hypothetical protein
VSVLAAPAPPTRRPLRWVLVPLLAGALVAVALGVLARSQSTADGTAQGTYIEAFFSDPIHMKAWLASAAVVLGCFQVFTATWIYGRLPFERRPWVNRTHRWSGRLLLVSTLPVAYHCLFRLGYQGGHGRVLAHSLLGCSFYGAFAAKILVVRLRRFPTWVLPTAGGLVFTALVGVWYTSAYWFFDFVGVAR